MEERTPKDLQGLLRFAMELTKSEDAPNQSQFQHMDEERKNFLEEVIKSMTIDVVEEFQKSVGILGSKDSSNAEKIEALESIREFVNNKDHANNFVQLGGDRVIISCLTSSNSSVRKLAADLIAEMCQHNPFCQSKLGNSDVFQLLIQLLSDEAVAASAMYAISCLIRHHEQSLAAFIELGGFECLLACAVSDEERISIKSCFLISALSSEFSTVRDSFIQMGATERLAERLKPIYEFDSKIELILSALNIFTECDVGKSRFQQIQLRDLLVEILTSIKDKEECEEIGQYTRNLLSKCSPKIGESAER